MHTSCRIVPAGLGSTQDFAIDWFFTEVVAPLAYLQLQSPEAHKLCCIYRLHSLLGHVLKLAVWLLWQAWNQWKPWHGCIEAYGILYTPGDPLRWRG